VTLEPTQRMFVPHRKRLTHTYVINEEGVRELRIDYGLKEITFDEPHLFAFGEQLVRESSFTGEAAMAWGPGYPWDELAPLFEALIEDGILQCGEPSDDPRGGGAVASRLPPSTCPFARSWSEPDCEALTREFAGRPIEIGYLEAVVPIFRIAHPALDGDGRQVGEANVYPARLRLDQDTEWRVCQYPGSRYRDVMPMNVTALKAMIRYWKPLMAMLLEVRGELQTRLGLARDGWTIGELHTFACLVLALPTFELARRGGSSPQAPLHPILSSLFRITDGVRMTTFDMLFAIEHTRRADERMTAAELHAYAETHAVLVGTTGVCAGPKPLIDEFLITAVDGAPAPGIAGIELPAELRRTLAELPAAIDYGLYALQSWAVSLSVWLAMSHAYEAILAILAAAPPDDPDAAPLRTRLAADWQVLAQMQITLPYDRDVHWKAYEDAYERSWRALGTPIGAPKLMTEVIPRAEAAMHATAAAQLRRSLTARWPRREPAAIDAVVGALILYLRQEQSVLESTTAIQAAINTVLDRPHPTRPLTVRDFGANYSIGTEIGSFPYLFDSLEAVLGIHVECTRDAIELSDPRLARSEPPAMRSASAIAGEAWCEVTHCVSITVEEGEGL
jgi:hypothetical protein